MRTLFSLRVPLRFMRGAAGRLGLTITAVTCGVALVCAVDLVNRCVLRAFLEIVDTMAGRAALQVTAGEGALFPEDVGTLVGKVPGVELAVPVVSGSAFTVDGSGQQLTVHGIDVANDQAVRVYEAAGEHDGEPEDPLVFLSRADSVLLTARFAADHRIGLGDQIPLETPSGRRVFTVRGLLAPKGVARVQGGNLLVMDIAAAEAAFTRPGLVNRVDVVIRDGADRDQVADAIAAVLPPGLRVEPPVQRKLDLQKVVGSIQTLLTAVGILGLLAAFLIAFSRLTAVFTARTWQVAILRATGMRARRVWWELCKESLLVGATGIAIGIPLGILLAHLLLPLIAATTALSSKLIVADTSLTISPWSLALATVLGIGAVLLAATVPAWRASRVPVAEILRQRGIEQPSRLGRADVVARGALLVLTGAMVLVHISTGAATAGLIASGLIVAAAAVVVRPALWALEQPLKRLGDHSGAIGRFAVAGLVQNPRRTALAVSTMGVGFGTVLWLFMLAQSFEHSVLEVMPGKLRGDLSVTSTHLGAGFVEAQVDDTLVPALAAVSGVSGVVGEEAIDLPYAGRVVAIDAFDAAYFTDPQFGTWPLVGPRIPGALEAVARGDAVVVSENFTRNLRVGVGDVLTLDTPSGPLKIPIAAVTRDFLSPVGTIEMERDLYKRWWRDPHVVRGLVKVAPQAGVDQVRQAIAAEMGDRYHLRILTLRALVAWLASQVRHAFAALHVLSGLVLLVMSIGIGDAMASGVVERRRDLGLARTIGLRRRQAARAVVAEALVLSVLGLILALALGYTLGALWVRTTFPALLGWTLSLRIPVGQTAVLGFAAIAVCLLSSLLPALSAVRLDPATAVRLE